MSSIGAGRYSGSTFVPRGSGSWSLSTNADLSLDRTIRFLAEHSSLDVECVAVARCRDSNGDTSYSMTMIADAAGDPVRAARVVTRHASGAGGGTRLGRSVALVERDSAGGFARNYRKQAAPAWRGSASSRFVKRAGVWTETRGEEADAAGSLAMNARGGEMSPGWSRARAVGRLARHRDAW